MEPLQDEDADVRVGQIITTTAVCGALCAVFVLLRMLALRVGGIKPRACDWLIFAAWLFVIATQVVFGVSIRVDNGKHVQYVKDAQALQTNFNILAMMYNFAICLIKLSNLALYAIIFPGVVFRRWLWAVGFVIIGWLVTTQLITVFACIPIEAGWNPLLMATAKCVNYAVLSISSSAVGIATDLAVLILPIPLVMKLQLKPYLKAIVIGVFVVGSCACIVTIVRLPLTISLITSQDLSYDAVSVWITTHVELTVGLFATSLPAYRPFLPYIGRIFGLTWAGTPSQSSKYRPNGGSGIKPAGGHSQGKLGGGHRTHISAVHRNQSLTGGLISVTQDVELVSVARGNVHSRWEEGGDSDGGPDEYSDEYQFAKPTSRERMA